LRSQSQLLMMQTMTVRVLGLLPLIAGLAIAAPVPSGGSVVHGRRYSGVILPATGPDARELDTDIMSPSDIAGFWTPGPRDVEALESRLGATLRETQKHPELLVREPISPGCRSYWAWKVARIREHLSEFRRQYVGVVRKDGAKLIYVNCFPGWEGDLGTWPADWKSELVWVFDGSWGFWRILYDVERGKFIALAMNGEA
jgi:hypothetical protein